MEKALFDAGFILESNYGDLKKTGWGRGSRTDKGVHAVLNTIKCKLEVDSKYCTDEYLMTNEKEILKADLKKTIDVKKVIKEINSHLPSEIEVFTMKFVTKNFDTKNSARSRKYEYIIPLDFLRVLSKHQFSDSDLLSKINSILLMFKGSHDFHNYTKKLEKNNSFNQRVIIDVKAEIIKSSVSDIPDSTEFVIIYIHGQSFLYHQIRKMVGAVFKILDEDLSHSFITESFKKPEVYIWLAPSQGLLLDRVGL